MCLLASKISSDSSFFFSKGLAYCTGRGEVFENIDNDFHLSCYLAIPDFGVSTIDVYRNVKISSIVQKDPKKSLDDFLLGDHNFYNDLEEFANLVEPKLVEIKNKLIKASFKNVFLTGSGSCFVCIGKQNKIPKIKNIKFIKISNIFRKASNWYT